MTILIARRNSLTLALVLMLVLCFVVPAWGSTIVDAIPDDGSASLNRGGNSQPLEGSETLQRDDKVGMSSSRSDSYVSLLVGDCVVVITSTGETPPSMAGKTGLKVVKSPYMVVDDNTQACPPSSESERAKEARKNRDLILVTKGKDCVPSSKPLSIPILSTTRNNKVATIDGSSLHLGWVGGKAPYIVEVSQLAGGKKTESLFIKVIQGQGASCCKEMDSNEAEVLLRSDKKFEVGKQYHVRIVDDGADSVEGKFTVVSQSDAKVVENNIYKQCDRLVPAFSVFCMAEKSVNYSNGEWVLEIYQKLATDKSYSAKLARLALAEGTMIKTPKK